MQPAVVFDSISKRYRLGTGQASLRHALASVTRRRSRREEGPPDDSNTLWALREVSFEIAEGKALGLVGPNGAGKTTILRILSHITQPTLGRFSVRGRLSALIELGAGFHPELTGRENVYLNAGILGLARREVDRSFDRIVEFSGLEQFLDTPVKRYSSGMYVRLGFSVAAHVEPNILLVDEVLAVGDAHFRQKCALRIQELQALGTTIVFVAHNLYLVKSVCDSCLFVAGGRVQAQGDVISVISAYEKWLHDTQEKVSTRSLPALDGALTDTSMIEIVAVELRDLEGRLAEDLKHDDGMEVRLLFQAGVPIVHSSLVLRVIRADGVTCSMIRTADYGIELGTLEGSGVISLGIDPLQLAGGAYAVEARLMGAIDGVPLSQAHSGWFRVSGLSLSHQEQSGVFVPRIAWTRVAGAEESVPSVQQQARGERPLRDG